MVVIAGFFLSDIEKIAFNLWASGSLLFSLVVSLLAALTLVDPKKNIDCVFYSAGMGRTICICEIVELSASSSRSRLKGICIDLCSFKSQ